jgi:hypothetical protein
LLIAFLIGIPAVLFSDIYSMYIIDGIYIFTLTSHKGYILSVKFIEYIIFLHVYRLTRRLLKLLRSILCFPFGYGVSSIGSELHVEGKNERFW